VNINKGNMTIVYGNERSGMSLHAAHRAYQITQINKNINYCIIIIILPVFRPHWVMDASDFSSLVRGAHTS
jgi:hypothetical protein